MNKADFPKHRKIDISEKNALHYFLFLRLLECFTSAG